MPKSTKERWAAWCRWRASQSRTARLTLWLLAVLLLALLVRRPHGLVGGLGTAAAIGCAVLLLPCLMVLLYRWIFRRLLWKVRSRLILTYLLMGFAPVVLFGTLAGISGYLFAGQYATSTALSMLDHATNEVKDETATLASLSLAREARSGSSNAIPPDAFPADSPITVDVVKGGLWRPLLSTSPSESARELPIVGQAPPPWLKPGFNGIVAIGGQLYLCSAGMVLSGSRSAPVLGSMPLNKATLGKMAEGLGTVTLLPGFTRARSSRDQEKIDADVDVDGKNSNHDFATVKGGVVPPAAHFFDPPVFFSTPLQVVSWDTGERKSDLLVVVSRPTLLYTHLFATSADIGAFVRGALILIATVFALLELLALLMALGLSRTITRSVADLYQGTREIDAGHLEHRVRVARRDQLGALASSFNSMAASIGDLLQQQREKDRLLSELAIAQEVQTNLFPRSPVALPGFELHAVCVPARAVSGDYFDFIFGQDSALCLALGDISGKGISAALLMASLHSAVRAFSLSAGSSDGVPPSPGTLLKLINRHLYRSTQIEKYATLFLACYDGASRKLTYSNGGHLPPLVISSDGSVRPLDCGGSVVGLLQGLEYSEATVELRPGDLLMAFSDGLTEPENEFGEFGEQRLLDYVRDNKDQPLPVLAANTLKRLQEWIGDREQPDDMTLLLARQL